MSLACDVGQWDLAVEIDLADRLTLLARQHGGASLRRLGLDDESAVTPRQDSAQSAGETGNEWPAEGTVYLVECRRSPRRDLAEELVTIDQGHWR
jgi:hypothetical protein